jgi:hypothetical protein
VGSRKTSQSILRAELPDGCTWNKDFGVALAETDAPKVIVFDSP